MTESVRIVAAVAGRTTADLIAGRAACAAADIVELRLDGVRDLDLGRLVGGAQHPVIATCRPRWEGGQSDLDDDARLGILADALDAGAHWIDVEWRSTARADALRRFGRRVVVSVHDFAGVPADLADTAGEMAGSAAGVVKVAVTPRSLRELVRLEELRRGLPSERAVVLIGMGPHGQATRLAPRRFGSCWTYGGDGVAPGQVPVVDLDSVFRVRQQGASTRWFGLIGHPVAHSPGPWMHNAAFAHVGHDAVYLPVDALDFDDARAFADWLPLDGASVTAPFKRDATLGASELDDLTRQAGAANTIRRRADGSWAAFNFDVAGFLRPLAGLDLKGQRALVIGAGGAARAAVVGLRGRGALVEVAARNATAAGELARELDVSVGPWPPTPRDLSLVVNTTPVGTWPAGDETPAAGVDFGGALVYDLVYNPERTALLRDADAQGCRVVGGLEMLVEQARLQFHCWTGLDAPAGVFFNAARVRLDRMRRATQVVRP